MSRGPERRAVKQFKAAVAPVATTAKISTPFLRGVPDLIFSVRSSKYTCLIEMKADSSPSQLSTDIRPTKIQLEFMCSWAGDCFVVSKVGRAWGIHRPEFFLGGSGKVKLKEWKSQSLVSPKTSLEAIATYLCDAPK